MKYRNFGRTGVEVSSFCLGGMMFGAWGNPDHDDCVALIDAAINAGINFIDTADVYGQGESEEIIGRAIAGRRDELVIATKCHQQMGTDRNTRGGHASVDHPRRRGQPASSRHRPDRSLPDPPSAMGNGSRRDARRAHRPRAARQGAQPGIVVVSCRVDRRGPMGGRTTIRERFVCEQPQYSMFARSVETAILPTCQRYGMAVIPWSPLSGGWLTGKYRRAESPPVGSRFSGGSGPAFGRSITDDRNAQARFDVVEALEGIARRAGVSLVQLALGFVDAHPAITSTIIGPKSVAQLDDLLTAADVVLDDDTLDAIDVVVKPGRDVAGVAHVDGNPVLADCTLRRRR